MLLISLFCNIRQSSNTQVQRATVITVFVWIVVSYKHNLIGIVIWSSTSNRFLIADLTKGEVNSKYLSNGFNTLGSLNTLSGKFKYAFWNLNRKSLQYSEQRELATIRVEMLKYPADSWCRPGGWVGWFHWKDSIWMLFSRASKCWFPCTWTFEGPSRLIGIAFGSERSRWWL